MPRKPTSLYLAMVGAAVLAAITPGAASAGGTADWRQFHGHANHRGLNRFERVVGPDNVFNLSLSWIGNGSTSDPDLVFKSSPTVVDGFVYFGTDQGQLLAFRDDCASSSCDPAWRLDLPEAIYNTPAVVDDVLYVGTASSLGKLYAFDVDLCAATGGLCLPLWDGAVAVGESSPTVAGGTVFVGSQFDGVYAFSASGCGQATCDPLWIGETGGYVINSPAVSGGVVYAGGADGRLYAFDADGCGSTTCSPLWTGPVSGPVYASSPAVANGKVYVASFGETGFLNVFAAGGCGAAVCSPVWKGTGGHYLNSSPAIAYGNVYIGSGDGTLLVYPAAGCRRERCRPRWIGDASGPVAASESAPMVANGVVYVGENNQRVYAFAAGGCGGSSCQPLWEFITQDPLVTSSPALVNGTLYVSGTHFSRVPQLYVFDLVEG